MMMLIAILPHAASLGASTGPPDCRPCWVTVAAGVPAGSPAWREGAAARLAVDGRWPQFRADPAVGVARARVVSRRRPQPLIQLGRAGAAVVPGDVQSLTCMRSCGTSVSARCFLTTTAIATASATPAALATAIRAIANVLRPVRPVQLSEPLTATGFPSTVSGTVQSKTLCG